MGLSDLLRQFSPRALPALPEDWHRVAPDQYQLQYRGEAIPIEVRRLRACRQIKLSLHGRGIVVSAPLRASMPRVENTLVEHQSWIVSRWSGLHDFAEPLLHPFVTSSLPLFGTAVPVRWVEASRISVSDVAFGIEIRAPRDSLPTKIGRILIQYYEGKCREALGPILNRLAPSMPRMPTRVTFKHVRSIWGSMNSKGVLSIERSLVVAPLYVFEYLIVHELCHLIEMNHSDAFWREVAARDPHYRRAEAYLQQNGFVMRMSFSRLTEPERYGLEGNVTSSPALLP